jgi:uncharacterized membrane protein
MTFNAFTEEIVVAIEATGIAIIVIGILIAMGYSLRKLLILRNFRDAYSSLRHGIGRSLLLGLDLLIASEIMRSIIAETIESVTVLGITIIIRTFLSLTLEVEIEGMLPWRRNDPGRQSENESGR